MEYRIDIEHIEFYAIIGLLPHERSIAQKVIAHATLWYDYSGQNYIDYAKATHIIKTNIQKKRFELLEEALHDTLTLLHTSFPAITKASLRITKPQILPDATPSVSLTLKFD